MTAFLEAFGSDGRTLVLLDQARCTLGRSPTNDVVFADDAEVSRLHAVLEQLNAGWVVRDLSSRNGTFVNGDRVNGDRPLGAGDEIRIGSSRCVLRIDAAPSTLDQTTGSEPPPKLTPRERDVLLALFKPALDGEIFTEPARTKDMAAALYVSEAAVKQHLANLYDKFAIHDSGERRRVRLANEALRRGAVTLADIRAHLDP